MSIFVIQRYACWWPGTVRCPSGVRSLIFSYYSNRTFCISPDIERSVIQPRQTHLLLVTNLLSPRALREFQRKFRNFIYTLSNNSRYIWFVYTSFNNIHFSFSNLRPINCYLKCSISLIQSTFFIFIYMLCVTCQTLVTGDIMKISSIWVL